MAGIDINEFYHNVFLFSLMVIDLKFDLLFMSQLNCLSFMKHLVPYKPLSPVTTLSLDSTNLYMCDLLKFFRAA